MSTKRFHPCDAGKESGVRFWILEGSSVYIFIGAFALGLALFRYCHGEMHLATTSAAGIGLLPMVLVMIYILGFKQNKPPSYDLELVEWLFFKVQNALARRRLIPFRHFFGPPKRFPKNPLRPSLNQ